MNNEISVMDNVVIQACKEAMEIFIANNWVWFIVITVIATLAVVIAAAIAKTKKSEDSMWNELLEVNQTIVTKLISAGYVLFICSLIMQYRGVLHTAQIIWQDHVNQTVIVENATPAFLVNVMRYGYSIERNIQFLDFGLLMLLIILGIVLYSAIKDKKRLYNLDLTYKTLADVHVKVGDKVLVAKSDLEEVQE